MKRSDLVAFLRFWERLPEIQRGPDEKTKKALRVRLEALSDKSLVSYIEHLRRRYDEQQEAAASASSRGGSLLVFVGALTAAATLLAGLAGSTSPFAFLLIGVLGCFLLYSALAATFLAIRSQQVSTWVVPNVPPEEATSKHALDLALAVELMAAVEANKQTHSNLAAYLRDGQNWARLVLCFVAILAAISVITAATSVRDVTASGTPTAAPATGPMSMPSPAMTAGPVVSFQRPGAPTP